MRTFGYIVLFVAVVGMPFVMRIVVGDGGREEKNGERLVVVTPNNQDIRQEFAWAFERWHREKYGKDVKIEYRTPGGAVDIKRVLEMEYRAGKSQREFRPDFDVVWGGGDFFFDQELKPLGVLQPLGLRGGLLEEVFPRPALAGVKLYDAGKGDPMWVGVALASYGIVYNPDIYKQIRLAAPRAWVDLEDPKLAGMLAMADPTHSGSVAVAYMIVVQRAMADGEGEYFESHPEKKGMKEVINEPAYQQAIARGWKKGMGELLLMAANARYFTASAPVVPNDVGTGDAAAGVAIDFYARVYEETVGEGRAKYVVPAGATAITPDPVGILAGVTGEKLVLARHFVEFLLTKEGQKLWALKVGEPGGPRERALRRMPARRDVYGDRRGWSDDENPFDEAGGFNQRAQWMGMFGDLRSVWKAQWIDSRDELEKAYGKIRKVKDEKRRKELLGELSDVPITMEEVDGLRAKRKEIQASGGDVEEWRARQQIDWGKRFRRHYEEVEMKAEE